MVLCSVWFVLCAIFTFKNDFFTSGQFIVGNIAENMSPLPFPSCRADNIECLRTSLRTFFFLMDSKKFGMAPVDPVTVNSVALMLPEQQMTFLLRNLNVTGARWTKLAERRFNVLDSKSGVIFTTDLHVTGEISMEISGKMDPYIALITMEIVNAESNITYPWSVQRDIDNEDYLYIGQERIAVRNMKTPSYFLEPSTENSSIIDETLQLKQSVLDHFSNEITGIVMHTVVDNFRLFSSRVPIRHYYKYY